MIANGFGFTETPATLNEKLKSLGLNQGFFGPLIGWFGVPRALPDLKLNKLIDCRQVPAPLGEVDAVLAAGKPVLVELDMSPGSGFQNHWVVIYAKQGNDYLIHDPWPVPAENSASLMQRYGFAGTTAQVITYIVLFDNPNFTPGSQPTPTPKPEQLVIVVNNAPDIVAVGGLALRDQPTAAGSVIKMRLPVGAVVTPLEGNDAIRQKVGVFNQWLNVKTGDGSNGWIAAWLVTSRAVSTEKSLPTLPARRGKGPIELDVDSAVQPPLRNAVIVVVKKSIASATIRSKPKTGAVLARVKGGKKLEALETSEAIARKKTNKRRGQWVKIVFTEAGKRRVGYIAENFIELAPAPKQTAKMAERVIQKTKGFGVVVARTNEPDARPVLQVVAELGLNLRDGPATSANRITTLPFGTILLLRELLDTAMPKIGSAGTWVSVSTVGGVNGFVSGEFVVLQGAPPSPTPTPVIPPDVIAQGCVFAAADTPLFKNANGTGGSDWSVTAGTPLIVMSMSDWSNIGSAAVFIKVRSYAFKEGFVRGSLVRAPDFADKRQRVIDDPLPFGMSAWNYGLHDPFDKSLFPNSGIGTKRGWVLFTHRLTDAPGMNYEDWSKNGWGVIARLNNDYGGSGTIPTPDKYDAFANDCKRWVTNSKGNIIWVIGNEMNNPREWPGSGSDASKAITPELYATCFNKARAAIKSVQSNAHCRAGRGRSVPGTGAKLSGLLEPHVGGDHRPRRNWVALLHQRLHARLGDIAANVHQCAAAVAILSLPGIHDFSRCGAAATSWQAGLHHRDRPHGAQPWSGGQNGWVQAAYQEVDRWNMQPQAQQIQSLILYRWSRDDVYSIVDKPGVQADIRATINNTDYRWRS